MFSQKATVTDYREKAYDRGRSIGRLGFVCLAAGLVLATAGTAEAGRKSRTSHRRPTCTARRQTRCRRVRKPVTVTTYRQQRRAVTTYVDERRRVLNSKGQYVWQTVRVPRTVYQTVRVPVTRTEYRWEVVPHKVRLTRPTGKKVTTTSWRSGKVLIPRRSGRPMPQPSTPKNIRSRLRPCVATPSARRSASQRIGARR